MERPTKRQKLERNDEKHTALVTRADDIHQWLEFQQSADPVVKDGINAFKNHLSAVSQLDDLAQQSKQLRIIKEYCEWQKAPSEDQLHFYDVLSTWSFAVDNNAEAIISAIPAALAQFLRTISGLLELRSFGLALVDTLLRRDQSKLFEKCLASPRSKPHLASPCLRLLTEMINFDAGARINEFWARRDLVMPKFDAFLEQQNSSTELEERRKPSVRRMALRLLLCMMKYFDSAVKTDLLAQTRALHACLRGLLYDGHDIILDLLQSLDRNLILDKSVPRSAIARFFNSTHLDNLAALFRFELENDEADMKNSVREAAHKTLLLLCTTGQGVAVPGTGWYPPSSLNQRINAPEDDFIDLGLDSPFYNDDLANNVLVANTTLSLFLQRLRPHEDTLQSQLLLATLAFTPELVAEFFLKYKQLPTAASDDVAWRGSFAILFSVIESSVPEAFGWRDGTPKHPPPPLISAGNILPAPLDRAYLMKLLSSSDEILKISGARILTVALKKLDQVLSSFTQHSHSNKYLWDQASSKTSALIESRIPTAREVLLVFQHTPQTSTNCYTTLLECIAAYYSVLPNIAATSTFDIGPVMSELCTIIEQEGFDSEENSSTIEQLGHAVKIAESSSSTKWLHKANNDVLSPFGQVLKTVAQVDQDDVKDITQTLRRILVYRGVIHSASQSFISLYSSLAPAKKFSPSPELFLFLDNCLVRANQKPVKCLDDIERISRTVSDRKPLSLFVGAMPEQWTYACKKHGGSKSAIKTIATWIARLSSLLDSAGENYRVMAQFQETMLANSTGKHKEYLHDAFEKLRKKPITIDATLHFDDATTTTPEETDQPLATSDNVNPPPTFLLQDITTQPPLPISLTNLTHWPFPIDIPLELQTNRLPNLLLSLTSPISEIRLQAFQTLTQLTHTLDTATSSTTTTDIHPSDSRHPPNDSNPTTNIHLLLSELLHSLQTYGLIHPAPTLFPSLTTALLTILTTPTSPLYTKTNRFLLRGPTWTPKRTLTYWLDKILSQEPDGDDPSAFQSEVTWLLTWLLSALRNEVDMDLYRRANVWERLFSLYVSPVVTSEIRRLIMGMVWVGAGIKGGADLLWTRFGVNNWLESVRSVGNGECEGEVVEVQGRVRRLCDAEMIRVWKGTCAVSKKRENGVRMDID